MEKNLVYAQLLDIYRGLLTQKQAEAMEYYYERDYSLGEISELMDISRQGVRDFIKRGETVMDEMEEKLNLIDMFQKFSKIEICAQKIKETNARFGANKQIDCLCGEIIEQINMNGAE